ncbi:hypothetical protein O6H91_21G053100 [Diphasiastrum complanatum]|uniref:Uncharacterized protein n=1 Tax=Diphasiastrum complanatum TaxID=34168 RepID=A0ACC2AKJ4_DIPCM|nr:hypothetical protein O6H91_21G053100 [Diphasiastrum complanatum]
MMLKSNLELNVINDDIQQEKINAYPGTTKFFWQNTSRFGCPASDDDKIAGCLLVRRHPHLTQAGAAGFQLRILKSAPPPRLLNKLHGGIERRIQITGSRQ